MLSDVESDASVESGAAVADDSASVLSDDSASVLSVLSVSTVAVSEVAVDAESSSSEPHDTTSTPTATQAAILRLVLHTFTFGFMDSPFIGPFTTASWSVITHGCYPVSRRL